MRGNSPSTLTSPLETQAAATDLISFLKALPDCRLRRGLRYPQWWMLLKEIPLAIYHFAESCWLSWMWRALRACSNWISAQIGDAEPVDTLVCDNKTLRGAIDETASGAVRYGLRSAASLWPRSASISTSSVRRELLDRVDLEGLLVQADALHANRPFPSTSNSVVPTS